MQNTQICTRLDGIRNHKSAAHNGGSRAYKRCVCTPYGVV